MSLWDLREAIERAVPWWLPFSLIGGWCLGYYGVLWWARRRALVKEAADGPDQFDG